MLRLSLFVCYFGLPLAAHCEPVAVQIDQRHPGAAIPKSFMGFSREWRAFVAPDEGPASAVHPTYLRLLEHLCAFNDQPLCVRVGGNSADGLRESPSSERWQQLAAIYKVTRTPLIINLNLQRENIELDQQMARDALKVLPREGILAFELGNEPDGWARRYRPADFKFEDFLLVFQRVGQALVPALTPGLAGPAYAHAAPPTIISEFLKAEAGLVNLVTVHSYRFDPKSKPKVERLLDDRDSAGYAARFADGVKVAHDAGLKIRLTESGTAWGGGVEGFSNSFAAALWTLDVFFEFAKVGLDGVHPHGGGTSHYTPIREDMDKVTKKAIITASAPYYGMLVFAEATAHNARFLPVNGAIGKTKVWATLDDQGVTRIVVINKDAQAATDLTLQAEGDRATSKQLLAPTLASTSGFSWAGQNFDGSESGEPNGAMHAVRVPISDNMLHVQVAPASAMMITVTQR